MESKRIKSAWEIALERAERLGSLTSEELQARQEEEARELGRGVAVRWQTGQTERDLRAELARHEGGKRSIIAKEAAATLIASLSPRRDDRAERALAGLRVLVGAEALGPLEERILSLWREYDEALAREGERREQQIRVAGEAELRKRGVSGSAVGLNPKAFPEWLTAMQQIDAEYRERLAETCGGIAALIA